MSYVYIRSEPSLWTVGFYTPDGKFEPESDHSSPADAATRTTELNGGGQQSDPRLRALLARLSDLTAAWQADSGKRLARANRLGDCRAGLEAATAAGELRDCAKQLSEAVNTAEHMHVTSGTTVHDISDCDPDYCGRYRGQRHTPLPGRMGTGNVNDDDTETLNYADESDYLDRS